MFLFYLFILLRIILCTLNFVKHSLKVPLKWFLTNKVYGFISHMVGCAHVWLNGAGYVCVYV
jgi:hypothetical protein